MVASLFRRSPSRRSLLRTAAALAMLATVTAGCGSDPTGPSIADTVFAASLGVDLDASIRTASGLYYRDVVVGTGAAATRGSTVDVNYRVYYPNGTLLDASDVPWRLTLGAGDAIPGFDEGVTGMRVGGTRQLIVPPHLAYKDGMILVFTVELVAVG